MDIRPIAVAASLLISLLTILVPDTPNDDAFIYIRTAEIYLESGLAAAFQHYAWASYSVLIALVSKLGLSLFTAAYVINGLFFAVLVYSFLSIVRRIDDSRLVMFLAGLCVLLYPQLNEYRYYIIRDVGFWAFSLFALWQFLDFYHNRNMVQAVLFSSALLIAASFRAEALIYLLLVPFSLLFDRRRQMSDYRQDLLRFQSVVIGGSLLAIALLALAGINPWLLLTDFFSVYSPFISNSLNPSEAESARIAGALFGEHASAYSEEYIALFLAAGLLVVLVANLFNGIGGPFFWLLVYGVYKRDIHIERRVAVPVLAYLLVNAVILFSFLYLTRYLSSRYAMLFCLLLALAVPLVLARIVKRLQASRFENLGMRVLILYFAYCGFDSFITFGESKDYVFDSVAWIVAESDSRSQLLTNNHAIAYFSGRVDDYDQIDREITEQAIRRARVGDLIALELHYETESLLNSEGVSGLLDFEVAFPDEDDRRVVIYRRIQP